MKKWTIIPLLPSFFVVIIQRATLDASNIFCYFCGKKQRNLHPKSKNWFSIYYHTLNNLISTIYTSYLLYNRLVMFTFKSSLIKVIWLLKSKFDEELRQNSKTCACKDQYLFAFEKLLQNHFEITRDFRCPCNYNFI